MGRKGSAGIKKDGVCSTCGRPCRACNPPSFIPKNPKVTIDQVLRFVAFNVAPRSLVTTKMLEVNFAVQGFSREDASNRLRKLERASFLEIAARRRRELFYKITPAGLKRAKEIP